MNTKESLKLIQLRKKTIERSGEALQAEKMQLEKLEAELVNDMTEMEHSLKRLNGLEYKIYYEIVVNGLNINKAINKVSLYQDVSESTLWKNYYPMVKEHLDKIKK